MSRAPRPGATKSRLADAIGERPAAALAEAFLLDVAETLRSSVEWQTVLFAEPGDAVDELSTLTGIGDARPQSAGDIGRRMLAAASELERDGYAPIIIVGSDMPTLAAHHLRQALAALRDCDVVFGPAEDGGYYLVGMTRAQPALFSAPTIAWGGPDVLEESERLARHAGLSAARIDPGRDIDTVDDLDWLRGRWAELALGGRAEFQHTAAMLSDLAAAEEQHASGR